MGLPEDERNPVVRYTAKELFDKIDKKLDIVLARVDEAATKTDLRDLADKHDDLAQRVVVIETTATTKRQMFGASLTSAGTAAAIVGAVLALLH